jgi:hypothetical protein
MKLQEQQKKDPEIEGLPSEGGQEKSLGTEPSPETQVLLNVFCVTLNSRKCPYG